MRHLHPTFPCAVVLFHLLRYLLVSPAFSTVSLVRVRGDVHSREKSGKYCTITCYTRFVPAVAHVRYDKLLPRHQEPRHRMYFYAGDAPQISSTKVSNEIFFRSILTNGIAPRNFIFALVSQMRFIYTYLRYAKLLAILGNLFSLLRIVTAAKQNLINKCTQNFHPTGASYFL